MQNILFTIAILIPFVAFGQEFKPAQLNPFGINTGGDAYNDMQFADMSGDGNFDIVFNTEDEGPFILLNQGGMENPDFSASLPLSFFDYNDNQIGQGAFTGPTSSFSDWDEDGDLDHLFFTASDEPTQLPSYDLEINLAEMAGPDIGFMFLDETLSGNEMGFTPQPFFTLETHTIGDLNGDGKNDLIGCRFDEDSGEHYFVYYQNTSTDGAITFNSTAIENPFGLTVSENGESTFGFPCLFDADLDADLDLLVNTVSGVWHYYENSGTTAMAHFSDNVSNPFGLTSLPVFGIPYALDVNKDGRLDIICGAGNKVYYFEATLPNTAEGNNSRNNGSMMTSLHPNGDAFALMFSNMGGARFSVFNMGGIRLISEGKLDSLGLGTVDISDLPSGAYAVVITGRNNEVLTHKFIKI